MGEITCFATDASIIDKSSGHDKIAFCYILYRAFAISMAERLKTTSAELVNTKRELDRVKKELKKLKTKKSKENKHEKPEARSEGCEQGTEGTGQ